MAITVQAGATAYFDASTGTAGNDLTTVAPPLPADVASGDLLLLIIDLGNLVTVTAGLSAWTQVYFGSNQAADNFYVYKKTAGASETAPIVTVGATGHCSVIIRVRGCDTATGPANITAQVSASSTDPIDPAGTGNIKIGITHIDPTAAGNTTWGGGATGLANIASGTVAHLGVGYKFEDTNGGLAYTYSGSSSSPANLVFSIAPSTIVTPGADFTGTPLSGVAPFNVAFTDTSTNTPTSWAWDFGDTGTSTSQNPTHSYTTSGVYTVALTATNAAGSNTRTRTAYITAAEAIVYAPGGGIEIY